MIRLGLSLSLLLLAACGQVTEDKADDVAGGAGVSGRAGSAKLIVRNSEGVASDKPYAKIKSYSIAVSGDGIDEPIVAEFSSDAEGGVIDGIPSGGGRTVRVQAINLRDELIREGKQTGVSVNAGETSSVEVEMDAVPIFANLRAGNVVPASRLQFQLYADPDDPLFVEDVNGSSLLFDVSANTSEFYPDAASGIALFTPAQIGQGEHLFKVTSRRSGKSSSVAVRVVAASENIPAPLFSGGNVAAAGKYLSASRAGAAFHAGAGSGAAWGNVLDSILGR